MATELTKPVSRYIKRANLIVTISEEGVTVREPRKRKGYGPLSYEAVQYYAAKQEPTAPDAVQADAANTSV